MQYLRSIYGRFSPTVWLLALGRLVDMTTLYMAIPFMSVFIRRAGASYATVGLVLALNPVALLLGNLLGGQWSDRRGRRPVILTSMALRALVLLGFAFAGQVWQFAVLWFGNGLVNALFNPAYTASVADLTPIEQRAEAFSLSRVATNFGVGLGPLLGSFLGVDAVRPIFSIAALSSALVALAFYFRLPEPKAPGPGVGQGGSRWRQALENWSTVFTDRALLVFIIGGILGQLAYAQINSSLSLHLAVTMPERFERVYGLVWTINGTLVVLLQIPVTVFFERFPHAFASVAGCATFAAGYTMFALAGTALQVHIAAAVWTVGEIILAVPNTTYATDIAPAPLRGRYVGAASLDKAVGGIFAPIAGTALLNAEGGRAVMLGAAGSVLLAGCAYAFAERERSRRMVQPEAKVS